YVSATDHEVAAFLPEQVKHLRQDSFVVLQVGIHHGYIRRGGGQNAFHAGGTQTAPTNPLDATNAPMGLRDIANVGCRSVRRIVVNKNDLPVRSTKHDIEAIYQERNVVSFVECRHDDGQLSWTNRTNRLHIWFGHAVGQTDFWRANYFRLC